jgi:hypothetical protein
MARADRDGFAAPLLTAGERLYEDGIGEIAHDGAGKRRI